jgi:hypothetical protein
MKLGPSVVGIIIAGALGYFLEPAVRPALLGPPKKAANEKPEVDDKGEPSPVQPEIPTPATIPAAPDWVSALTPEQLPEMVTLNQQASLPVAGVTAPMVVPAGVQVKPVRVEGGDLVINFAGTAEGNVPVMSTSLVQDLGNKPPIATEVAMVEPETPEAPDPVVVTPPAETPEPAEAINSKTLTPEEIVSVMQASVKAGEIKEFAFDQVLGWKAAEDKEMGGESYQSGLASYKAETIFGVKNIQAQALIKGGKVEKWIWPKSGMEIK